MRRIWRLPLGERWLLATPALSSSPGHAPTQDDKCFCEANVAALAPTSAMICCAESTPRPGTSASRCTASWCSLSRLAISCSSLTICCSRNCNSSSTSFRSRRYTGLSSVQALSASHNCAGVARNFLSAKAATDVGLVSPSASACSIRRALRPSRSETRLDNLIWVSSSRLSSRFCNCTRSQVNWYFLRITVRQSRCSLSGTKLKVSSWATNRFTNRSASGKSFFRPCGPRLDCACARCSAPDIGPAPSRFWQVGFQYCSSAPQTGFQYCAVDSITTSSTSCATNQSESNRRWSGVVPNWRLSNWYSLSPSTSATTTANIFL